MDKSHADSASLLPSTIIQFADQISNSNIILPEKSNNQLGVLSHFIQEQHPARDKANIKIDDEVGPNYSPSNSNVMSPPSIVDVTNISDNVQKLFLKKQALEMLSLAKNIERKMRLYVESGNIDNKEFLENLLIRLIKDEMFMIEVLEKSNQSNDQQEFLSSNGLGIKFEYLNGEGSLKTCVGSTSQVTIDGDSQQSLSCEKNNTMLHDSLATSLDNSCLHLNDVNDIINGHNNLDTFPISPVKKSNESDSSVAAFTYCGGNQSNAVCNPCCVSISWKDKLKAEKYLSQKFCSTQESCGNQLLALSGSYAESHVVSSLAASKLTKAASFLDGGHCKGEKMSRMLSSVSRHSGDKVYCRLSTKCNNLFMCPHCSMKSLRKGFLARHIEKYHSTV